MLHLLVETKKDFDYLYVYHRFYTVIKYYCGYVVWNKVVEGSNLSDYKNKNLRDDIFLDVNIPDTKTLLDLHTKLMSGEAVLISTKEVNNKTYKFICLENDHVSQFETDEVKGVMKFYLNHTKIIDSIIEANWDEWFKNSTHPNHVVPIVDKVFNMTKTHIKDIIESNF